jgi:hypothetical protein
MLTIVTMIDWLIRLWILSILEVLANSANKPRRTVVLGLVRANVALSDILISEPLCVVSSEEKGGKKIVEVAIR